MAWVGQIFNPKSLILVSASPGEARVARVVDGVLADFALWRPGSPDGLGDVHVGRVLAPMQAMGGAFVAIEGDEGFLPDSAGGRGTGVGQMLIVRITRAAQAGKGPRLAVVLADAATELNGGQPRRISRGPSPLHELALRHANDIVEVDDPVLVPGLLLAFGDRVRHVGCAFSPELDDEIAGLVEPSVVLPGGARLHIEPTRALTAIDLDAGAMTGERSAKAPAQLALNRAILPELARQIRLRNLGGAIVVDLAGMPARRRVALAPVLAQALADDPAQPRLLGFTALGFAEISRPRHRPPLHELLAGPLAAGLAALRESLRRGERKLRLCAAPAVIAALEQDGVGLADLARRRVHRLMLRSEPSFTGHHWVLEEMP